MKKTEYLGKLHDEILQIMDEIDRVCRVNGLTYYLVGGSLLGAVRHKGFIPWDDDFDIAMPREDFEKFTQIYHKQMRNPYILKWDTTDSNHNFLFAKVENKDTLFGEELFIKNSCPFGIFVDIFPLDTTKGYNIFLEFRKKIILKLARCRSIKRFPRENSLMKQRITSCLSRKSLSYLLRKVSTLNIKGDYYSNFASQYNIKKQTILKQHYGEPKRIAFENRFYNVPFRETAVLESIYGLNYMEIPPIEKRRTHYPLIVKFSNQEVIEFGLPEKRIRVE